MCFYGHLNEVKRIIKEGVDVNGKGLDGMTALRAAREGGSDPEIIDYLISIGAK